MKINLDLLGRGGTIGKAKGSVRQEPLFLLGRLIQSYNMPWGGFPQPFLRRRRRKFLPHTIQGLVFKRL